MGPVDAAAGTTDIPDKTAPADAWPRTDSGPAGHRDRPPSELRHRMADLPAGHPSSSYDADGTPRQPAPRLGDLDPVDKDVEVGGTKPSAEAQLTAPSDARRTVDEDRHLTEPEWTGHVTNVRDRLNDAHVGSAATDHQHTIDPKRRIWSGERDLIHDSVIENAYTKSADVPCERKAIIAGGLGGAGKSTVLGEYAGIDLSRYLTINPDNIKEDLANRGLIPHVDGLTPMEASDLVHEESSHIAKRLARRAEAEGKNIIWDITMSSRESVDQRIDNLESAGYTVHGIFVDIPVETSVQRANARHREGHEDYRAGIGQGGRYVPAEVILAQADPDWGSKNRKIFEEVKPRFDGWSRFDNSVNGRPPVLSETSTPAELNREEKT